jgi:hypothetical protein
LSEDEVSRPVQVIETYEELMQKIEAISTKFMSLSAATIVVAAFLLTAYAYKLSLPLQGVTNIEVSVADPVLLAVEAGVALLLAILLYVALRNFVFIRRLSRAIRRIRAVQRSEEEKIEG